MLFANVCAGFISSCYGERSFRHFLGAFWLLLGVLCIWKILVLLVCCVQDLGYVGVPPAGHALWAEVGGGITFVTSRENASQFMKRSVSILGFFRDFIDGEPYMLASAGQPSLHGNEACMVYWTKGALRRNRRQRYARFSCLVVILGYGFGV